MNDNQTTLHEYPIQNSKKENLTLKRDDIQEFSQNLRCECPTHLLQVIDSLRNLISYQSVCIADNPSGYVIHSWLLNEGKELEKKSLELLGQLLSKENVI